MQTKEHIPARFEQHCILFVFEPNFLTQLSPTVPKQQRNRQRRKEKEKLQRQEEKKRTNKQNSSWSPKALMKREFSSLSENFSPLQRLACISKVTASVCSFVCVCVLLLSCCLGCESGWRVCRGHKEIVCVFMHVCVWVNEPPLGLNSSLSHQSTHQGSAGDGGQALPAIWSCKRFQGAVCICVCLRVCMYVCAIGWGGYSHQTCLLTN